MIETFGYEPKTHVAGVCDVVRAELITPHMRRITLHGTGGITDGVINSNNWKWTISVKMPRAMTIEFSAEVDGNSMSGMAKITNLGAFGKIPFTGKLI
jgi:hypothetical protein